MNLLEKTEQLFHSARLSFVEAAAALYEVRETKAWESEYETWQDYLQTISVSQSQASKWLSVFEHYALKGAVSHAKIAETDVEKLYLATTLTGTPDEQATKAALLTRSELRAQRAFEDTGDEHECEAVTICTICHKRLG